MPGRLHLSAKHASRCHHQNHLYARQHAGYGLQRRPEWHVKLEAEVDHAEGEKEHSGSFPSTAST